jgi:putative transcriptional regulator
MQPKKPLDDLELAAFEAGLDMQALLVQSAREMAAGTTRKVYTEVVAARQKVGLSQARFAEMMGVSKRTLEGWEQGRREPTGAAKVLIKIAMAAPEVLAAALSGEASVPKHKASAAAAKGLIRSAATSSAPVRRR